MVLTTEKSISAANQQGTCAIAWLAGFFDGEGSVGIYGRRFRSRPQYYNYSLRVTLTNTDVMTLDHIKQILDNSCLAYYVQENQIQRPVHWKPRWQMLFTGFSRSYMFLKLIRPYLVTKAQEVDLALEFLESRMNTPSRSTPYSQRDLEIIELLRDAKSTRHLRD